MSTIVDEVEICGHFVEDCENQRVLFDDSGKRYLNESLVKQKTIHADLTVGYDRFEMIERFDNEMRGILEYLQARMGGSNLTLQQAAHDTNIVTRRSLLCRVASTPSQKDSERDSGYTLIACKLNGIVFLCEPSFRRPQPSDEAEMEKEKRIMEKRRQNAYVRAKITQGVTLTEGQQNHSFAGVASTATSWNVMSKFRLTDQSHQHTHQILIASTASAIDENKEYVQIIPIAVKSAPKPVEVLIEHHMYPYLQLRYLLSALFSGQRRMIGGVYIRNWSHLKQIVDIDAAMLLPHVNLDVCLKYLFDLLTQIRAILCAVIEGTFIVIERQKGDPEHTIRLVNNDERSNFDFVGQEFRDLVNLMDNQ